MSPAPRSRNLVLVLALLLLWSMAIRVWFGSDNPTGNKFWDERYGLENIRPLVLEGQLKPENGFHPSLSYLPQGLLFAASHWAYEATGNESLRIFLPAVALAAEEENPDTTGRRWPRAQFYSPTAYRIARYLQAIFGAISLLLLFRIGNRLFPAWASLMGTALLAGTFWHVRQSAIFKPDILLILLSLLVMDLTLKALENPTLMRYLKTGLVIGLTLATKFNAGPIAVPLIAATFMNRRQGKAVWGWLAAAGLLAALVFLVLNPFVLTDPGLYSQDFGRTLEDYAKKGQRADSSHLFVLWHGLLSLLSGNFHGILFGGLGVLALLATPFLPGLLPERRRDHLIVLSFVVAYAGLYAASTTNPSPHNWLPLSPWITLYCGALLYKLWDLARGYWSVLGRPWAAAGLLLVLLFTSQTYSARLVYSLVIPDTSSVLADALRDEFGLVDQRLIVSEPTAQRFTVRRGRPEVATTLLVDRLTRAPVELLDSADAEVFPLRRLRQEPDRQTLQARTAIWGERSLRIQESRIFRVRGESIAAIVHSWRPVGEAMILRDFSRYESGWLGDIPAVIEPGQWLTFEVRAPRSTRLVGASVGDQRLELTRIGKSPAFRTLRFVAPPPGIKLVFELEKKRRRGFDPKRPVRVTMRRWAPPQPAVED